MLLRQVRHIKRRRAKGRCGYAGCDVQTGTLYRCPKHAAEHAANQKARRERKKQEQAGKVAA